jgi:hypothetical protein
MCAGTLSSHMLYAVFTAAVFARAGSITVTVGLILRTHHHYTP